MMSLNPIYFGLDLLVRRFYLPSFALAGNVDCFDVKLTTAANGTIAHRWWTLGSCRSVSIHVGIMNDKELTQECCLTPGHYELECRRINNGYYIEVNGEKYCENLISGSEIVSGIKIGSGNHP